MDTQIENQKQSLEELNECIHRAMNKVTVQKETDLCRFIPGSKGRLHHFAFTKLKATQPLELQKMIQEHILEIETPEHFSRKNKVEPIIKKFLEVKFKRSQINRMLEILKNSGDKELIAMFSPYQTLEQAQKSIIDMVRAKEVDQDLWATYVKLVQEKTDNFYIGTRPFY